MNQFLNINNFLLVKKETQIKTLQGELDSQNEIVLKLQAQIKEYDEQIGEQKKKIEKYDEEISQLKNDLEVAEKAQIHINETNEIIKLQFEIKVQELELTIVDLNQQMSSFTQEFKQLMEIQNLQTELKNQNENVVLQALIKEYDEQIDKQKQQIEKYDEEISQLKNDLEVAEKAQIHINEINEIRTHQFEIKVQELELTIVDLNQQISSLTQEFQQLMEIQNLQTELKNQNENVQRLEEQIKQQDQQMDKQKKCIEKNEKETTQLKQDLKDSNAQTLIDEAKIIQFQVEIQDLKQNIENSKDQISSLKLELNQQKIEMEVQIQVLNDDHKKQIREHIMVFNKQKQLIKQDIDKYTQQIQKQMRQLEIQLKTIAYLEEDLRQFKEKNAQLQSQINQLQVKAKQENEAFVSQNEAFISQLKNEKAIVLQLQKKNQSVKEANLLLNKQCQDIFNIKTQLEENVCELSDKLKEHNKIINENNQLKYLLQQMQEQVHNSKNNNEYQTLYLQQKDDYNTIIKKKDQQLQQSGQYIQELEVFKDQVQFLEQNNSLLTNQLRMQQQNNLKYQQKNEELEAELNNQKNNNQDINDLQLALKSFKEKNDILRSQNYEQNEIIKDYEIQLELLKQIEQNQPIKIQKLQLEKGEVLEEFNQYKQASSKEIHYLKQEKQYNTNEIADLKQQIQIQVKAKLQLQNQFAELQKLLDVYLLNEKALEQKVQCMSDSLQTLQLQLIDSQDQLQKEILELNQNIKQLQSLQNLTPEINSDICFENEKIISPGSNEQKADQVENFEKCQTDAEFLLQSKRIIILEEATISENNIDQGNLDHKEQEIQTDFIQYGQIEKPLQQEKEINHQLIQTDQKQEKENKELIIQKYVINFKRNYQQVNYNRSIDFMIVEQLKKKIEHLISQKQSLEKQLNQLKDQNQKLEQKIQILQKLGTPRRRQLDAKDERKQQQDNEMISQLQQQIIELEGELQQNKIKNQNEQFEQQSIELKQLQAELNFYKDQLIRQKQQTIQYKGQLENIYRMGPNVLNQLQSESIKELQPLQLGLERYQIQSYLYVNQQRISQSQFLEIQGKQLKVYQNQHGRINKSVFDSYMFNSINFDTSKMFQGFDQLKLNKDMNKVFLIFGQSKSHKKLIMMMLIELINKLIQKQQLNSKISVCYSEKINNQWIEIEQFNNQSPSQQDLECTIYSIKTHFSTKQNSTGQKIRKLSIVYQSIIENEVSSTSQFIIATCSYMPSGDFQGIIQQILNLEIGQNMELNIFFNISSQLQHYQKTKEILYMAKLIQLIRNNLDMANFGSTKFISECKLINLIEDELQRQTRCINNRLILKNLEVDQIKKVFDNQLKQSLQNLLMKQSVQSYQNTTQALINNIILEIKQKIDFKMNQKQNKQSKTIAFLDRLAIQLDQIIKSQSYQVQNSENMNQSQRNRTSEIPLF